MSNEITAQQGQAIGSTNIMFNPQSMDMLHKMAHIMSTAICTVPKHLQGNVGDCFAIAMQASAWGMSPYACAQKTHLVNGVLGYEAQLVNAVITSSNAIDGHFSYQYSECDWKGDSDPAAWVRVGAKIRGDDTITWGERLYPSKVTVKNSPLWKSDPKQQSAYLALKKWARLYLPALIMGVYTPDELETIERPERVINNTQDAKISLGELIQKIGKMTELDLTVDNLKNLDIAGYSQQERNMIKSAIKERRSELKESAVVATVPVSKNEPNWLDLIANSSSKEELSSIENSMQEDARTDLAELISERYDYLRSLSGTKI